MTPDLLTALTGLATFAFAAASPGPATLAVAATAMSAGRARGLSMALGLAIGLGFWGILAAIGVGALVAQSAMALTILKGIGGLYLLYLAVISWRSANVPVPATEASPTPSGRHFRRGLILNLGNPKAVLAWVAALALGSDGAVDQSLWLVGACIVFGFVLYAVYALVFSLAQVMSAYRAAKRWVDRVFAVLFAAAGVRLLLWSQER